MTSQYVMAMDAGTTGIRAILFDHSGDLVAEASQEFPQIYPEPGWVEHNPLDIWNTQITVAKKVLDTAGVAAEAIVGDRHHQPAGDDDRLGPADRPPGHERHRLAGPPDGRLLRRVEGPGIDRLRP